MTLKFEPKEADITLPECDDFKEGFLLRTDAKEKVYLCVRGQACKNFDELVCQKIYTFKK